MKIGKMYPLADRWVQMLIIKKKIRRKHKELKKYKLKARRRLRSLRRIRVELLDNLRALIDTKLHESKLLAMAQSRALLARMLKVHRRWIAKWHRLHKLQEVKILLLRNEELKLNRRLQLLRKQLKLSPNRKKIVARCFRIFNMMLRSMVADGTSPEVIKSWKLDVNQIRHYIIDSNIKHLKPAKRRAGNEYLSQFTSFWESEVMSKRRKAQRHRKHKDDDQSTSHAELPPFEYSSNLKRKSRKHEKPIKIVLDMPSLKELNRWQKKVHKIIRKDYRKLKKEQNASEGQHTLKHEKPKRSVHIPLEDLLDFKVDLKLKLEAEKRVSARNMEYDHEEFKQFDKELRRFRMKRNHVTARDTLISTKSSVSVNSRKSDVNSKLSEDKAVEDGKSGVVKKGFGAHLVSMKKRRTLNNYENVLEKEKRKFTEAMSDDVTHLLKNKSVSPGIRQAPKTSHWRVLHASNLVKKRRRTGPHLLAALETKGAAKYRSVQALLRDAILAPSVMDMLADKNAIVNAVSNHYMWKNLASVYQDLKSVNIPKKAIYQMLREQYFKYISEIVGEEVRKGAKLSFNRESTAEVPLEPQASIDSTDQFLDPNKQRRATLYERAILADQFMRKSKSYRGSIDDDSSRTSQMSFDTLAYAELKRMDDRYTRQHLQRIYAAHQKYFKSLAKTPVKLELEKRREAEKRRRESASADQIRRHMDKYGNGQRSRGKVDIERLYYEPRRTCRQRQAEEEECAPCDCDVDMLDRCMRCGIELPALAPSSQSSGIGLSLSTHSIAACARNRQVLQVAEQICHSCGFPHDPQTHCPMLAGGNDAKTLQQLSHIRQYARRVAEAPGRDADSICRAAIRGCAGSGDCA